MKAFRNLSPIKHLAIASGLTVFIYALFTLAQGALPHPEDFSPTVYVVAFTACLLSLLLVGSWRRFWGYLPIWIFCTLAFLDEIGYGAEVDWIDVQPLTIRPYNVQIHDLHNLIGLMVEVLIRNLEARHWNSALFEEFLGLTILLGLFGLAFAVASRLAARPSDPEAMPRLLQTASYFSLAAGATAAIWLLALPRDPRHAFLLGYSVDRIALAAVALIGGAAPWVWYRLRPARRAETPRVFERKWMRGLLAAGAGAILAGYLVYICWAPLEHAVDQRAILARISPLVVWLAAEAWLLLLLLVARKGSFNRPLRSYVQPIDSFFRHHPAYVYTTLSVTLILAAQVLFDKGILPLNRWLVTPGFWLNGNWELWTEETWEMTGGFLFLVASFAFPRKD